MGGPTPTLPALPGTMRAVEISAYGPPESLRVVNRPVPACGPDEVLVKVAAAGINRPDDTQRRGLYPPPPGITDIPGLDVAGQIVAVGADVAAQVSAATDAGLPELRVGQYVCALVAGGGYAEYINVPWQQCLAVPAGLGLIEASSLPEVFFTAWNKLFLVGRLAEGETVLVQGGSSGVGMAAIQLARTLAGARVIAMAGTEAKCRLCLDFGAHEVVNYRTGDWARAAFDLTDGKGLDLILDAQAGDYLQREVDILAVDGRIVLMGTHQNVEATVNFRTVVRRRLTIAGSVIRARTPAQKGLIATALRTRVWPSISRGDIRTDIHRVFDFDDVVAAHQLLQANEQAGKLVLRIDADLIEGYPIAPRISPGAG